ncbi:biotin-dependent carboxyltransferase family protein [Paenibacillus sp. 7124]|uniref:Biotin-dependent carboxyltransferase family protein n=1 Tax=Paenibacillus apii TaxID=1850370 RepID=A0A6M1PM88_9BACL|nr:biotin-dependent carboxyltransferase family protein [Paenibacillus apii]NGM83452.1 biotin-dependent carboxyltransferase family protein [Paenibacillus apii]
MSIYTHKPGPLTTVQDLGRTGYGKYGVIASGAMDRFAHRTANWLVGNNGGAAALEITLSGFAAEFRQDHWIAVTGGDMAPVIDGSPVPMWRPVFVRKGSSLVLKRPVSGCQAYVAVSGGLDVPEVMSSRSTYLRAGIGGFGGRPLKAGDELVVGSASLRDPYPVPASLESRQSKTSTISGAAGKQGSFYAVHWAIPWSLLPAYSRKPVIRVIRGRQWDDFTQASRRAFLESAFLVTPQSDRMGYRLSGPSLKLESPREYLSEAVAVGTVQIPADGQPIVLMADRQTLGGYPKIAQVISADLPVLAQTVPGGHVAFREVTPEDAESLYLREERKLKRLEMMIRLKLKEGYHA